MLIFVLFGNNLSVRFFSYGFYNQDKFAVSFLIILDLDVDTTTTRKWAEIIKNYVNDSI